MDSRRESVFQEVFLDLLLKAFTSYYPFMAISYN